jgi:MFS family permease
MAWLSIPALLGPIVGPPVGGFITTYFDWPWIFWINIPVGVLGLVLALIYIPEVRGSGRTAFDRLGFVLSGLGLVAFMAGSTTLGLGLLPAPLVFAFVVGGALLLYAYVVHSRRVTNPIVDLKLLAIPTFRHSIVGALLFRVGLGASPFLLPLLLQVGFGMSAFQSGLITFASAAGALAMKFLAPPLLRRYGFRSVLLWNTLISALFVALPAVFVPSTPVAVMIGLLLVGGFFRSLQLTAINALSYADISPTNMSQATTLASVAQQVSLTIGISVGAVALETTTRMSGGAIDAGDFWPAFLTVGLITALSLIPFARLSQDAGDEMSGRPKIAADSSRLPPID